MTRRKRWIISVAGLSVLGGVSAITIAQAQRFFGDEQPGETPQSIAAVDAAASPVPIALAEEPDAGGSPASNPLRSSFAAAGPPAPIEPAATSPPPLSSRFGGGGATTPPPAQPPASPPTAPTYAAEESAYAQPPSAFSGQIQDTAVPATAPVAAAAQPAPLAAAPATAPAVGGAAPAAGEQLPPARGRFGGGYDLSDQPAPAAAIVDSTPAAVQTPPAAPIGSGLSGPPARLARGISLGDREAPAGTSVSGVTGSGRPGAKPLEGAQTPSLTIEKFAPAEIQIGKPAIFELKVRNVGQASAEGVRVHDVVPQGTTLVETTPAAAQQQGGEIVWQLGTLAPGEEKTVSMQLTPNTEGEIGSVATVTFTAQASARTRCTRPQLVVESSGPRQVLIGQTAVITVRLSNPGTGAATQVVLEEDVPEGLTHPAGRALEFEAGTLMPGETRELALTMTADKPGTIENIIRARADANLNVESRHALEVIAPDLAVQIDGPTKRYLERQASHDIMVANPGTAPAKDIEMVARLPKGLQFVSANNQGQYDPRTHAVYWSLEQLPPRDRGSVTLTTLPIEAGDQKIRVESRADMGLAAAEEQVVAVEGLAALFFEVADAADPIEVGGETLYEVRVINQGSKTSTNIRLGAVLPPALKPTEASGPTSGVVNGQQVVFEPLARLAPKADALYRIKVQGVAAGNQRVSVQLVSDEIKTGVTKEESTRVYADQ